MSLTLIAAIGTNNVIGTDNDLPWHLPEDLKHFKECTKNKTVLMGRKTWESIPEKYRPLPKRTNIVITRQADYTVPEGVLLYTDLQKALDDHRDADLFVIGGATIYAQTIDKASALEITHVDQAPDGDVHFPTIDKNVWQKVSLEDNDGFCFVRYEKINC